MGYYNRLGASTTYTASTDSYDVGSGAARLRGFRTFTETTPNDQEQINVFVKKDDDNWNVDRVYYDSATTSLIIEYTISNRGTISDGDPVDLVVTVVADDFNYANAIVEKTADFTVDDAEYFASLYADLFHYNSLTYVANSSSSIVITLGEIAEYAAVFDVIRAGTGTVTFTPAGGSTINGGTSDVSISAQWKGARLYNNVLGSSDWCVTFSA